MAAADFTSHNEQAQGVWAAYRAGRPLRAPGTLCVDTRFFILNDEVNSNKQMSFQQYSEALATDRHRSRDARQKARGRR
jgi:hypothetical protein